MHKICFNIYHHLRNYFHSFGDKRYLLLRNNAIFNSMPILKITHTYRKIIFF